MNIKRSEGDRNGIGNMKGMDTKFVFNNLKYLPVLFNIIKY